MNVRRPRAFTGNGPIVAELAHVADDALPPTVLRLPNLAAIPAEHGIMQTVLSIMHWAFIAIGALLALWLIFGGRGGPKPVNDELPAAPARAQVDSPPAWNPPPLPTAGDSEAPKWTPPAVGAAPSPSANVETGGSSAEMAPLPAASEPGFDGSARSGEPEASSYESWPRGGREVPEEQVPHPESAPESAAPAAPAWQEAAAPPISATAGPIARTASRETPAADPVPGGEAHPLDLTVPVPQ